jgi:hypothetical protein
MTLAAELAADRPAPACVICSFLTTLPEDDAAEWRVELRKPVTLVSHTSVLRALLRRDVSITESSVKRHRRLHA